MLRSLALLLGLLHAAGASGGGLGFVIHGSYPLSAAEAALRDARREGDDAEAIRCEATADLLRAATGRIPQDLRRAERAE